MNDDEWMVTLTIQLAVKGARSKSDAVEAAIEHVRERIRAGEALSMRTDARKMTNLTEEEPLFGVGRLG
ncbi:MAG: hypothetical protein KO206_03915 [Methanomicrobiaceae archaeon]|uniref:Uncharacterized protein n=1 Tax=hydrocarbon metagenome TaxID=938273 RepID=A0A0W8FI89_9ZZZZ|nr:hypothetical protein [Methanomicrobiaceae archaeon]MDD5419155.1 hypothetical protein [Methanomicrobiaceae archaeon]